MSNDNDKSKKSDTIISFWNLVFVIIAVVISYIAFSHDKRNSPLIISYESCRLVKYTNASNNSDNKNGSQTPSIANITGKGLKASPEHLDKNNLIELSFKKIQGDASRIYIVDFYNKNELKYQLTDYSESGNNSIFTVKIPITIKETTVEDTDSYNETSTFSVPCLQRFALAFIDYNGNTYIYYVVVRPKPIINRENYEFFSFINYKNEEEKLIYDIKNWTYDVAFIDCSITNSLSIRQAMLNSFNNENSSVEQFQYDEATNEFLSSFSLFPKEKTLNTSAGKVNVIPKVIVIHDTLDIDNDLKLLRSITNDQLT